MNWKKLKKKYPDVWNSVHDSMITDLLNCMDSVDVKEFRESNGDGKIARLAHNAAFLACYEVHKLKKAK